MCDKGTTDVIFLDKNVLLDSHFFEEVHKKFNEVTNHWFFKQLF